MRVRVEWQRVSTSELVLTDEDLREAAAAGVDLDDELAVADWVEARIRSYVEWQDEVEARWTDRDPLELLDNTMVYGDPPQWWIDEHPDDGES